MAEDAREDFDNFDWPEDDEESPAVEAPDAEEEKDEEPQPAPAPKARGGDEEEAEAAEEAAALAAMEGRSSHAPQEASAAAAEEDDDDLEAAALMAWSSGAVAEEVAEPPAKAAKVAAVTRSGAALWKVAASAVKKVVAKAGVNAAKYAVPDFEDEGFEPVAADADAAEEPEDAAPAYVPTPVGAWKEERRIALEKQAEEEAWAKAAAANATKGKGKGKDSKGAKRPGPDELEEPAAKKPAKEVTDVTKLPSGVGMKAKALKAQGVKLDALAAKELSLAPPRPALTVLQELVSRRAEGDQSAYVIKKLRAMAIASGAWKPTSLNALQASKFIMPGPAINEQAEGTVKQRPHFERKIADTPHAAPGEGKAPRPRANLDFDKGLMQGRALSVNKLGVWPGSHPVDEATLASLLKLEAHNAIELIEKLLALGNKNVEDPSIWLRTAVAQAILDKGKGYEMTKFDSHIMSTKGT